MDGSNIVDNGIDKINVTPKVEKAEHIYELSIYTNLFFRHIRYSTLEIGTSITEIIL